MNELLGAAALEGVRDIVWLLPRRLVPRSPLGVINTAGDLPATRSERCLSYDSQLGIRRVLDDLSGAGYRTTVPFIVEFPNAACGSATELFPGGAKPPEDDLNSCVFAISLRGRTRTSVKITPHSGHIDSQSDCIRRLDLMITGKTAFALPVGIARTG